MAINSKKIKVVYILGSGHCGSTLLNLLLNGHSQVCGLSELNQVRFFLNSQKRNQKKNSSHTKWEKISKVFKKLSGNNLKDINVKKIPKSNSKNAKLWITNNENIFFAINAVTGKKIFVDSSKDPKRLNLLKQSKHLEVQTIHLVRDGRAVINSYVRKYHNFFLCFHRWFATGIWSLYLKTNTGPWLEIRYEDLVSDPQKSLKSICKFIGVKYQEQMLNYRSHEYIGVCGNFMVNNKTEKISKDNRWKQELSKKHKLLFYIFGSPLNFYRGYQISIKQDLTKN